MPLFGRLMSVVRSHAAAGVVLFVCLAATLAMSLQVRQSTQAKDAIRYGISVNRVRDDISRRLGNYIAILQAGAGLLAAQPDLSRSQFHAFVERIELQSRYPGVQGIGYTRRVWPSDLASFTAAEQRDDPGFHVWPRDPRAEYHAIVFLEPLDRRNRAAIGYDMFTEPVRRAAMARARDTGVASASGRVTLVQEIDREKQSGFLIYTPVYHGGEVPETVGARRERLRGFVYSPFRVEDFLQGVFGTEQQPRVGFEIYDEGDGSDRLLFRSTGFDPRGRFTSRTVLEVAGRTWALSLSGTPALEDASSRSLVPIVVAIGLGVSVLLATLTALQTRARRRLESSEAELLDTSQRFQLLADSIAQLVWVAHADGWIYWYNRRWYDYTGTTPEEMQRWGWERVLDLATLPRVLERWQHSLSTGETFEMEFPIRSAGGEVRWFLTRAVPIRNARGQVTHWFGTNTDVQSRRDAEQRLEDLIGRERALREEAERVGHIKDEFLATLSHELRTPLNAVIGWVHLLREGGLSADAQRRALATVHRNARQQARLIEDLLDMSRIISGKVRLETRVVDLNDIVEAAINVVRPAAAANKIAIEMALDRRVPLVVVDPGRIQQVLWNLLNNAVKFTPEAGGVKVTVQQADREVQVVVSDTGVGIDAAFLPYVFDRFRQADSSSTRQRGGLGLGLSIVKSLVEMHGGTVHAASGGLGHGATFTISLRAASTDLHLTRQPQPSLGNVREHDLSGTRVLLVENDPDARELARLVLERAGASVVPVTSGDDALAHVNHGMPALDLIVSDLAMPGMDGFAFIRSVRQTGLDAGRRTPALAVSAYARAEDRVKASEAGFDAYLSKPFQPDELVSSCAALLDRARLTEPGSS